MADYQAALVPRTLPIVPMDPLAALFAHATPSARTFFTGNLCEVASFTDGAHLHFLTGGALTLERPGESDIRLSEPTLLFSPRGDPHRFSVDDQRGADLACASVDFGGGAGSPIADGLPHLIVLPLASHAALAPVCNLLMSEAFAEAGGRQVALDRLFDYLLIIMVRHVIDRGLVNGGVLAGLADPRLSRALTAMHEAPGKPWSLDDLADAAGMSRTRFADHFRSVVGRTPMDYLTLWRMTVARRRLAAGKSVKSVAAEVGYESAAAFSRVFSRVLGQSPREQRGERPSAG